MVSFDGYYHLICDRCDLHVAICYLKGYIGKVRTLVCKILCRQTHIGRSGFRALRLRCSAEAEIAFLIQLIADGYYRIAGYLMLCSVVDCAGIVSYDSYYHFFRDRCDLHVTVCYLKGYIAEVRTLICKILCLQAHIGCSGFRTLRLGCSDEVEIAFRIQLIADSGYFISGYLMLFSVVDLAVMVSFDGYYHFFRDRRDLHITICYIEYYFTEVFIFVLKMLFCQTHIGRSGFRTLRLGCSAEAEIAFPIQLIADGGYLIAGYHMLCSVVDLAVMVSYDGYYYCISSRSNFHVAICHRKGYIAKVCTFVFEVCCRQAHIGLSYSCTLCFCISAEAEVVLRIQYIADFRYLIAGYHMLCSVVDLAVMFSFDGYYHFIRYRRDLQLAVPSPRHNILFSFVNGSYCSFSKCCRILASVCSLCTHMDS